MPKYHCIQCGQPVDSGSSFAPVNTRCPSCNGGLVPQMPEAEPVEIAPPPLPPPPPHAMPAYHQAPPTPPPAGSGKSARIWVILSTLAGAALLTFSAIMQNNLRTPPKDLAFAFGEGMGSTLFVAGFALVIGAVASAILLAFKKPFRATLGSTYSITVIIVALLAFTGQMFSITASEARAKRQQQAEITKQEVDGIVEDMESFLTETRDAEGYPKESEFRLGDGKMPESGNEMEISRHLLQSVLNDTVAIQNEYVAALEKEGLMRLLEANRLDEDKDFSESREILLALRTVAEGCRDKSLKVVDSIPERLERYKMSPAGKRAYLAGYQRSKGASRNNAEQTWKLELEILDQMSRAIDHLEATRAAWTVEDSTIVFAEDRDLDDYNAIMAEIDAISAKQTQMQENAKDQFTDKMKEVKESLSK
jgi:hypothetical protein